MNGDSLKNVASGTPAKIGIAAVGGAGAAAMGMMLLVNPRAISLQALLILLSGMVFVALMVLLYSVITRQIQTRANARGDEALVDELGRLPKNITDPEILVRLKNIRDQFLKGVAKFKANGVKLTEVPWYLIVGESGSGKTEVVRNSGIEFAPGLSEKQQGAGGTVNMDWSFTDHGVILDTAGRFVTNKIDALLEWKEFLSLLVKVRKEYPVNGLILALPALKIERDNDGNVKSMSGLLINEDSAAVEKKIKHISDFIRDVRKALGVRFPIYVVVTKSDLIPGFREFFENINHPELQHQMLGWSNPKLEAPFDPDTVGKAFEEIRDKLVRRRFGLMRQAPVVDELEGMRKVDSLYLFPDSLMQIAPRLQRYLQGVFTKGKFSQSPPFLRGVYFTSAMEEGAELDEALARIRGITLAQLEKEGQAHRRERAVFLRDLFMQKIFRESGLVTREVNVDQSQRRRKMLLLGAGFACVAILFLLTWYSTHQLNYRINPMETRWGTAAELVAPSDPTIPPWTIVSASHNGNSYSYQPGQFGDDPKSSAADFVIAEGKSFHDSKGEIAVPFIFRATGMPWANSLNSNWQKAYSSLVGASIVQPAVQAAENKMKNPASPDAGTWDANGPGTKALLELIHLQEPAPAFQIQPVLQYVAPEDKTDPQDKPDFAGLQNSISYAFPRGNSQIMQQPGVSPQDIHASIAAGIAAMNAYWTHELSESGSRYSELAGALDAWKIASDNIVLIDMTSIDSSQPYSGDWDADFKSLKVADDRLEELQKKNAQTWGDGQVAELCEQTHKQILDEAKEALGAVAKEIPDNSPDDLTLRKVINRDQSNLEVIFVDPILQGKLTGNQALLKPTGDGKRVYEVFFADAANTDAAGKSTGSIKPTWDKASIAAIEDGSVSAETLTQVQADAKLYGKNQPLPGKLENLLENGAIPASRAAAITEVVEALQEKGNDIRQLVKSVAELSPDSATLLPAFPNTKPTRRDEYQTDAANKVMQTLAAVDNAIKNPNALLPDSDLAARWRNSARSQAEYSELYCQYWTDGVYDDFLARPKSWADVVGDFQAADGNIAAIRISLQSLERLQLEALNSATWIASADRQAISQIDDQQFINTDKLDVSYADHVHSWEQNQDQGIDQLIDIKPADFNRQWKMSEIYFWRRLQLQALNLLASHAREIAQSKYDDFERLSHKFPLVRPATDGGDIPACLSPDEYTQAQHLLKFLAAGTAYQSGGFDSDYAEALRNLHDSSLLPGKDRDRLQKQQKILQTLWNSNTNSWAPCSIAILKQDDQDSNTKRLNQLGPPDRITAEKKWQFVEIAPASNAPLPLGKNDDILLPTKIDCQASLNFTFNDPNQKDYSVPPLSPSWGCIALIFQPGASQESANSWIVPVQFNSQGPGSPQECLWLRVTVPSGLPGKDEWPTDK